MWEFVIYRCVVGSRAYGLATERSDWDRRGFFLPPADSFFSLAGVPEQLEKPPPEDECYWEIGKFLRMGLKATPQILECLYTPLVEHATPLAQELLSMRDAFLSKRIGATCGAYASSQLRKLEQDARRGSIKWKHAMHLIRILLLGRDALRSGTVRVLVGEHREKLLAIRRGETPWEDVDRWHRALQEEVAEALATTPLPDEPDTARVNAFLVKARRSVL